ncbi:hypothetical protein [Pragia fontium]|uniref:hypothetical protein n=1 Tax=Pragia fontium TaxID=82985 RepID=UPI000F6B7C0E|nr:hypothetical protein [Pragia fontium]VEJ53815.1 Uncharacterised protein [Pragia fontium]
MVTDGFKALACSYFGCDGGNVLSDVWICGLEWGYQFDGINAEDLRFHECSSWEDKVFMGSIKAQYNQKLAWFYNAYYNWDEDIFNDEFVSRRKLLSKDGVGFKMNAFPIGFKNRSSVTWDEKFKSVTNLNSFEEYVDWCVKNRGEFFRKIAKESNTKMIVCTGISNKDNFFKFFDCDFDKIISINNDIYISNIKNSTTKVVVTRFFNYQEGCINSKEKMKETVLHIKENIKI